MFRVCVGLVLRFTINLLILNSKLSYGKAPVLKECKRFPLFSKILNCAGGFILELTVKKDNEYWKFKDGQIRNIEVWLWED